ncbi:MAG: glucose-6-phosphate dehydrogenase assembly protein OpcA [Nibricoccus sp.]
MAKIFDALPGIDVPVASISKSLADIWVDTAAKGGSAPASDDVKATQVNFVLHLGYNTTVEDAVRQFGTAVLFSKRAPSRVVVLCPLPIDDKSTEMRAKIYGECHLGKTKGDTRCCEFVLLSYPFEARKYLESQLSVCLVADLPLYYWVHRFASIHRLNDYQHLLRRSERILIDSAISDPEIFNFAWPRPEVVHDLVYARLLPVRQSIGQLLSGYEPAALARGLTAVVISHEAKYAAEARALLNWTRERLAGCGAASSVSYETKLDPTPGALKLDFNYNDGRYFRWHADLVQKSASIEADLGAGKSTLLIAVSLLARDAALSDALFF